MLIPERVGVLMTKVGVTAIFDSLGVRVPVTLLLLEDTIVVDLKTSDVCGYDAVVMGVSRKGRVKKPQECVLRKKNVEGDFHLFESRVRSAGSLQLGDKILVNHFFKGQFVDVSGRSVGKGFAGVMKRHNFRGLKASHGVSIAHRSQGSTGQCQDPGRVFKGKKMAGHMGDKRVTVQNLEVLLLEQEESMLVVRGTGVPGACGSYVFVRDAVKKPVPRADSSLISAVSGE